MKSLQGQEEQSLQLFQSAKAGNLAGVKLALSKGAKLQSYKLGFGDSNACIAAVQLGGKDITVLKILKAIYRAGFDVLCKSYQWDGKVCQDALTSALSKREKTISSTTFAFPKTINFLLEVNRISELNCLLKGDEKGAEAYSRIEKNATDNFGWPRDFKLSKEVENISSYIKMSLSEKDDVNWFFDVKNVHQNLDRASYLAITHTCKFFAWQTNTLYENDNNFFKLLPNDILKRILSEICNASWDDILKYREAQKTDSQLSKLSCYTV